MACKNCQCKRQKKDELLANALNLFSRLAHNPGVPMGIQSEIKDWIIQLKVEEKNESTRT